MQYIKTLLILLSTTFFISCGENTTTAPIADVVSISLDDSNISIYSTQLAKPLTATVTYADATTADATANLLWSSSDSTIFQATVGSVLATKNGGDANLTASYADTFYDSTTVHVKELLSIQYSDVNVSDVGTAQIIYISGTFENNETNVTLETNIAYYSDENATITDINATQFTLTVDVNTSSIAIRAVLFENTDNTQDFNTTF
ncbi:hypothetical protein JHD47_01820 [Sulfurimonas sp. SAG-AH-194-L11]|nr:hypothetical protein [Sulfurimonas sp. SAG-AH-194-L11]MDF1876554.1 hypothetical protein [Sulfurimonas sp. SAG-AH-194-L11]